jgi:hypothetical protein
MHKITKSSNIENDLFLCYKSIKKYLPKKNNFIKLWLKKLKKLKNKDYNEFKRTNKSNNIPMHYDIITMKKNTFLNLHIHQTIELIYVVKGKLYESRFNKIIPKNKIQYMKTKIELPKGKFTTKINKKGKFLVNNIGSAHYSYTRREETILLVLWGRKHKILI